MNDECLEVIKEQQLLFQVLGIDQWVPGSIGPRVEEKVE